MSENNTFKSFNAGEIVMKQGEPGDCAYLVEEGKVEVIIENSDGTQQRVGTRGVGTMIGEMAVVDNAPRTATVRAIEDCKFLKITADDFERRLKRADPILKMVTHVILARYRDTLVRSELTIDRIAWSEAEEIELNYKASTNEIERVKLDSELKAGFDNGDLYLNYQPIIDLSTGQTAGFEALMRWNHPERGPISPMLFIPSAEETGLIHELSQWALKEACSTLKRIEDSIGADKDLFMSVNFSGSDFAREGFTDDVTKVIRETGIKPRQLHIEMTEQVLMANPEKTQATLQECADSGIHISIDDFGTGYSSLSYLHRFPVHTLKVDRSFVMDMSKDKNNSTALVKSIVGLGKNMGMAIIAEGAETSEEVHILKEMGCDMVQGYFFAKPMMEDDVINFVTGGSAEKAQKQG